MRAVFFASLVLLIIGCNPKGSPIMVLGSPHFVPQSQPDSVLETGIGQDPSTGGIFLQWYSAVGATGYKVYRSDSTDANGYPIAFVLTGNVMSSSSLNDTSMVDVASNATGVKYYYYLRAYTPDGALSNPSDTVNYTLLDRPNLTYPVLDQTVSLGFSLEWHDNTGGGYAVIRVRDISVTPVASIWVSGRFQTFDTHPINPFNFDSTATGHLVSGHTYQWRVDRFNIDGTGRPFQGARSDWATFKLH